ncbi:MAG: polyphosphate kinase 2 [Verrucomicrobiota bacterium]
MSKKQKKNRPSASEAKPPKLTDEVYEAELEHLQTELVHLQDWVKSTGQRIVVIFEGRDAAGKGGVIKRISERVSPRVFRTVAMPAPTEREKTQLYFQRYIKHLPAAGEVILFDRSWYNRAGVERVMGFCTEEEYKDFLRVCPGFERWFVDQGIILLKYWLDVSNQEQEKRFLQRINDPKRRWKLSPMDLESRRRWYDYSRARDDMFEATDTAWAPWYLVDSNDKKRARLNCISHLLKMIPYEKTEHADIRLPKRSRKGAYDSSESVKDRLWIQEKF